MLAQTWLLGSIPSPGVGEELSPEVNSMLLFAPMFRKAISSLSNKGLPKPLPCMSRRLSEAARMKTAKAEDLAPIPP